MRKFFSIWVAGLLLVLPVFAQNAGEAENQARLATSRLRTTSGSKGVVVSGTAAATAAGTRILEAGGNAADAGAATILALSVTTVGLFCIGGEVPMLVYDPKMQDVKVLAGMGRAPLDPKAIDWYLTQPRVPEGGVVRSAAVPATLDAAVTLLKLYGTKSFKEIVQPTLEILAKGGPNTYRDAGKTIQLSRPWREDLTVTFRKLIESEEKMQGGRHQKLQAVTDRFYRGDIADELEKWYIEMGGFLRKTDLAAHKTRIEEPLQTNYRGYTVYKVGPWTQGPFALQTLRLLEGFNLKGMGFLSADYIHAVTEAMKLGLADRDEYYGDPEFVRVPMPLLLSDAYTQIRRPLIDMKKASLEIRPGDPYNLKPVIKANSPTDAFGGTTMMVVADKWGGVVSATPSGLNSTAGVAGTTGVIHGTRLVSLNTWKGHPNVIEPGKRPRITLTPTLVFKNGKPSMAISVAGGDLQDQAAIEVILQHIEFGMTAEQMDRAPRFMTTHHVSSFGQAAPKLGSLQLNAPIAKDVQEELKKRGHDVTTTNGSIAWPAVLVFNQATGVVDGAGAAPGKAN